jgi:hypothetical protein
MRGVVDVETDQEVGKVALVLVAEAGGELGRILTLGAGAKHDRRAVRVAGTYVTAVVAAHALETHPDVGLDHLDQVTEMNRPVDVRQCAGDEDLAGGAHVRNTLMTAEKPSSMPHVVRGEAAGGRARRQADRLTKRSNLALLNARS